MNVISGFLSVFFCLLLAVMPVAADENSPSAGWFHREGQSYFKKGDNERAILYWKQELALKPADPNVLNNIGIAYKRLGRLDEALRYHNRAIEANPQFGHAYYSLGQALLAKKDYGPASESLVKAAVLNYEADNSRYWAAQAFIAMRDYPMAIENLEALLKISPAYPGGNYHMGKCLLQLGEKGKSARYFAVEAKLSTPFNYDALQELKQISPLRYQLISLNWAKLVLMVVLQSLFGYLSVWLSKKVLKLRIIKREWQTQILFISVVLFVPFPMYLVFGAGWMPPVAILEYVVFMMVDRHAFDLLLFFGWFLYALFLLYLYLADRFTVFLADMIQSRSVYLTIALTLGIFSFFDIYLMADVGGGRHHYSSISFVSECMQSLRE